MRNADRHDFQERSAFLGVHQVPINQAEASGACGDHRSDPAFVVCIGSSSDRSNNRPVNPREYRTHPPRGSWAITAARVDRPDRYEIRQCASREPSGAKPARNASGARRVWKNGRRARQIGLIYPVDGLGPAAGASAKRNWRSFSELASRRLSPIDRYGMAPPGRSPIAPCAAGAVYCNGWVREVLPGMRYPSSDRRLKCRRSKWIWSPTTVAVRPERG